MGKRFRKKSGGKAQTGTNEETHRSDKFTMNAINNFNDVELDEVDKFHEQRNEITFDGRDKNDKDLLEEQEEVMSLNLTESEEDSQDQSEEDSDEENEGEEDYEDGAWGEKRGNYYDGDEAEDEEDAKLEEEEAIRLQKKRATAMDEEDFLDQIPGQLTGKALVKDDVEDQKLVFDLDKELDNIDFTLIDTLPKAQKKEYSHEEAIEMIESESPELLELLGQLEEKWILVKGDMSALADRIKSLRPKVVKSTPILMHFYLKYGTYLNYLTNISFYLHLKSSGVPNVQNHPVIDILVKYANILKSLDEAEEGSDDLLEMVDETLTVIENGGSLKDLEALDIDENDDISLQAGSEEENSQKASQSEEDSQEVSGSDEENNQEISQSEEGDLSSDMEDPEDLEPEQPVEKETTLAQLRRTLKKISKVGPSKPSDFHDSEYLDEVDAMEKTLKKKTLRHHASMINQTNQKRSRLPKFSGDADLPYKSDERKHKVPASQAINQESNDADIFDDNEMAEETKVAEPETKPKAKKQRTLDPAEMEARVQSWKEFNPDEVEVEEDKKRIASYKILKNKGLAPKRKKEQRNPRVKHRKKFEKASKKLSSFKRVVQTQTSSYGGETTGIKTHLSRSVRFQ